MMIRTVPNPVLVSIRVEIKKVVKVKAYTRLVNGKIQRVRSYYKKV
ncbi:MAG: hypothetical protein IKI67_02625 [Bacteroidales bacterium]|nr:hypothetical protein [Bacteroidales bacterium]